jgi:predicted RNase H-like HicB family nuclease
MDVDMALEGMQLASGASYAGEEFKTVARMLLDAPPNHAVRWDKLARAVGGDGVTEEEAMERGEAALEAMVEANVLAYRPKSSLSRDIPPEVFEGEAEVGTALTPAHLHALRLLRGKGRL